MPGSALEPAELMRLAGLIRAELGLCFDESRWPDLLRHLKEMTAGSQFSSPKSYLGWLFSEASPGERVATLAAHLTIGETYFFRDPAVFTLLTEEIIPTLLREKADQAQKNIVVWSAGCSSGEEPYSIAIAASQSPGLSPGAMQILASDVNAKVLAKAKAGLYTSWSFRNPPPNLLDHYFSKTGRNGYQLIRSIMEQVRFLKINLLAENYPAPLDRPGGVDLIFCRNVLMYFDAACRARIVARLARVLAPGGWLIVSPSETAVIAHPELRLCQWRGNHYFRQGAAAPVSPPPTPRVTAGTANFPPSPSLVARPRIKPRPTTSAPPAPTREPGDSSALATRAKAHADGGELALAEECYRQALAGDKLNPLLYFHLAMILLAQDRREEAANFFKKTLFLEPGFLLAHFQLACILPNREEAKKYGKSALALADRLPPEEQVPHSEGITVGLLRETLDTLGKNNHG